jgi:DNA-binding CsgD family transcriptional regulator
MRDNKPTPKQMEIIKLIGTYGMSNKVAARMLNVSPETIKTHLRHVFTKYNIKHRAELHKLVGNKYQSLHAERTLEYLRRYITRTIIDEKDVALVEFAKDIIRRLQGGA